MVGTQIASCQSVVVAISSDSSQLNRWVLQPFSLSLWKMYCINKPQWRRVNICWSRAKIAVIVHAFTLVIGHLNHCNIQIVWGPLRYVFNSSTMHLLHHSRSHLRQGGVNFGLSLSCWDYLFKTAVTPSNDGELELGFDGMQEVPSDFVSQLAHGFRASQSR